jgi:chemotaxis family two-component system response regulator Rcp1
MRGNVLNHVVEILLVEDSKGDIGLTKEALKEIDLDSNMAVVNDGVEAINYLRKEGKYSGRPSPDMILLDLQLPKKTGHEVLAFIKSDTELKEIPVAVLTSSQDEEDIRKAYKNHVNGYITKKPDLKELAKNIENFYGFSQLRKRYYKSAGKFRKNRSN